MWKTDTPREQSQEQQDTLIYWAHSLPSEPMLNNINVLSKYINSSVHYLKKQGKGIENMDVDVGWQKCDRDLAITQYTTLEACLVESPQLVRMNTTNTHC